MLKSISRFVMFVVSASFCSVLILCEQVYHNSYSYKLRSASFDRSSNQYTKQLDIEQYY